jgi:hypothetical protein
LTSEEEEEEAGGGFSLVVLEGATLRSVSLTTVA